jgi:hypothetical protein
MLNDAARKTGKVLGATAQAPAPARVVDPTDANGCFVRGVDGLEGSQIGTALIHVDRLRGAVLANRFLEEDGALELPYLADLDMPSQYKCRAEIAGLLARLLELVAEWTFRDTNKRRAAGLSRWARSTKSMVLPALSVFGKDLVQSISDDPSAKSAATSSGIRKSAKKSFSNCEAVFVVSLSITNRQLHNSGLGPMRMSAWC